MSDTKYTYAVAQIRAMELGLLSQGDIDQLIGCKTDVQCLQMLQEKGWGGSDIPLDAEAMLACERQKAWCAVRDLVKEDPAVLDVLSLPDQFHNLKAAVKQVCTYCRDLVHKLNVLHSCNLLSEKCDYLAFSAANFFINATSASTPSLGIAL